MADPAIATAALQRATSAEAHNGNDRREYGGKRQRIEEGTASATTTSGSASANQPASTNSASTTEASVATIADFIDSLADYEPTIPDEVVSSILRTTGCDIDDPRLLRLISLSAQRFVFNVAEDAQQVARLRTRQSADENERSSELTMDDLTVALSYQGIQVSKPAYYADHLETPER